MPRDSDFFRREGAGLASIPAPRPPTRDVVPTAGFLFGALYSVALTLGRISYPHYRHHRRLNAFLEAYRWVIGRARKIYYGGETSRWLPKLVGEWSGQYFLVALQVHYDYQLKHSPFRDVQAFIEAVLGSFAAHARSTDRLIVKHHPLDRASRDYSRLLRELGDRYGLRKRLVYVHDIDLPTMLEHARGTVVINSTVGLMSIHHGTPVKVMGSAVYDLDGLTSRAPLAEFWTNPGHVDRDLYQAFRRWLLHHNQANGSFYLRLRGASNPTGVNWYPMLGLRRSADTANRP